MKSSFVKLIFPFNLFIYLLIHGGSLSSHDSFIRNKGLRYIPCQNLLSRGDLQNKIKDTIIKYK